MTRRISEERKLAFYVGTALQGVGALLFLSTFVSFLLHFGDFDGFEEQARSGGLRALGGMVLLVVGGVVRGIGARGLAGSGLVLDPERARDELEPHSRMAGGMVGDALDEAGIDLGRARAAEPRERIVVRCTACSTLNDEDARFCKGCGASLGA